MTRPDVCSVFNNVTLVRVATHKSTRHPDLYTLRVYDNNNHCVEIWAGSGSQVKDKRDDLLAKWEEIYLTNIHKFLEGMEHETYITSNAGANQR